MQAGQSEKYKLAQTLLFPWYLFAFMIFDTFTFEMNALGFWQLLEHGTLSNGEGRNHFAGENPQTHKQILLDRA